MASAGGDDGDILTSCLKSARRRILSVGSGDGSQQEAIVRAGHPNILTTFYESSEAELLRKYPHAGATLRYLEGHCPAPPVFGVDARELDRHRDRLGSPFDLIFFTFPHSGVGNGRDGSVESNQDLIRGFLRSSGALLSPDGEVQITLKNGGHYDRWQFPAIVREVTRLTHQGSHDLEKGMFPGYVHRLTKGMGGYLKEVNDRKGAVVHVFRAPAASSSPRDAPSSREDRYGGKLLTIVTPGATEATSPPSTRTPRPQQVDGNQDDDDDNDDRLKERIRRFLSSATGADPPSVLDVRRGAFSENLPDVKRLNRVLYGMEAAGELVRRPPPRGGNQKPRWELRR